jgi:protoporphyrinogen oxidase
MGPSKIGHENNPIDVAIVGAGCAGLYCAWRLVAARPKPTTYVFEKDARIGGRLLSVDILPPGCQEG